MQGAGRNEITCERQQRLIRNREADDSERKQEEDRRVAILCDPELNLLEGHAVTEDWT
jgi:hypothetical protein